MQIRNGRLTLSPSDLTGFTYCPHLTERSLAVARGELAKPTEEDPDLDVIFRRGLDHERDYLARLRADGLEVVEIDTSVSLDAEVAETLVRLHEGPEIIYQAAFYDTSGPGPAWRGHADFLRRVPAPSRLGPFSYEPEDTKLARRVKPTTVLQLCDYAAHLERLTGTAPEQIHVVLGGRQTVSLRLADYAAYYRAAKQRFVAAVAADAAHYPDPVGHCGICAWRTSCDARRMADDHLSLVAGARADQIRKIAAAGINTMATLAVSSGPVDAVAPPALDKLRRQAVLQVKARATPDQPPPYELLEDPGDGRGLFALPAPSPGDLYFDIEGDPFEGDGGLEYLFGVGWSESDGTFAYRAFWGTDNDGEKLAFEQFMDFVAERRAVHPDLHVYHYAAYETTAMKRLMGRHGTREEAVDALLRGGVMVDLYGVVRHAVRVGVPSYGLKKIEALFMAARSGDITDGGSSIVEFERWIQVRDQAILDALESYNRDDCESTQLLHQWLEGLRRQYQSTFGVDPLRPAPRDGAAPEGVADEASENAELVAALGGVASDDPEQWEANVSWLLAQVLDWHRREEKPEWWRYFDRVFNDDEDDFYADSEAVAGLVYQGEVGQVARSTIHRYRFDPEQEHKLSPGHTWCDPASERAKERTGTSIPRPGKIVDVDPIAGTVDLIRGNTSNAPHPGCLIPPGPIGTVEQRRALRRVARSVGEHGIDGPGPYRATRDLLLRRPPRLAGMAAGAVLTQPGEASDEAVVRLAQALDHGTLAVQGPPGSGKTRTAARTIAASVRAGHKVGVTANSHAVITNLLDAIGAVAEKSGHSIAISQKVDEGKGSDHPLVTQRSTNDQMLSDLDDTADVLAGTAWLFCRPEFDQRLDYLVVDEAGQLSLANVIALSSAAKNLIMVGDPNQLAQPSKGTHPAGVDVSGLSHLLGQAATMAPHLGIFLDHTHRLHPSICDYISEVFYDGRLSPQPDNERQTVLGPGPMAGSGLRWLAVEHTANRVASREEAEAVYELFSVLIGRQWIDRHGEVHEIEVKDILVVAPYNAQVSLLSQLLPDGAVVGTVDRFQGRQAAIVIVSMAASSPAGAQRGLEFLYSRHRLNVAVSRAQALSIMVASPALLSAECRTVEQMRLVNALCRFSELAEPTAAS